MKIGANEANLPALHDRVARGESITITRRGKPVAGRLERLRLARSSARNPITVEEILAAKSHGRR